jgi:hypothetical protein
MRREKFVSLSIAEVMLTIFPSGHHCTADKAGSFKANKCRPRRQRQFVLSAIFIYMFLRRINQPSSYQQYNSGNRDWRLPAIKPKGHLSLARVVIMLKNFTTYDNTSRKTFQKVSGTSGNQRQMWKWCCSARSKFIGKILLSRVFF